MMQNVVKASEITTAVAFMFMARSQGVGLDGIERDRACLEYFIGAAASFQLRGETEIYDRLTESCEQISQIGYQYVVDVTTRALVTA